MYEYEEDKRTKTVRYELLHGISILEYAELNGLDHPRDAFEFLPSDNKFVSGYFLELMSEFISKEEVGQISIESIRFLYCDSANYTHAGALFSITIQGPLPLIRKFFELYTRDLTGEFSVEDDICFRQEVGDLNETEKYLYEIYSEAHQELTKLKEEIFRLIK